MDIRKELGKYILADGLPFVADLKKSKGSWVVDLTGKKRLDCYSMHAAMPLGFNHPSLKQYEKELKDVLWIKPSNSDFYTEEYLKGIESIAKITPDFDRWHFIDGGTLGVEGSLKCAFDWKMKKSGLRKDKYANQLDVVHLDRAFHGRSGYSLSLLGTGQVKTWGFPKFNWTRISNPAITGNPDESLSQAEKALERGNVAAVIAEPICSEGGDLHVNGSKDDNGFLQRLRCLAKKYDTLFIVDEVQTGVGLTGKMWAYQHFDLEPDMLVFGKKTFVSGFCATKKIDEIPDNVFTTSGRINSTFAGNLIDYVRCRVCLKIIKDEKLVKNAEVVGKYLLKKLQNCKAPIKNVRGKGLLIAFDPVEDRDTAYHKLSEKMVLLKAGDNSIRLRPHLTFSKEDADQVVEFIESL